MIERQDIVHPDIFKMPPGQQIDFEDGGEVWTVEKHVKNGRKKIYTILQRKILLKMERVGNSCLRLSPTGEGRRR